MPFKLTNWSWRWSINAKYMLNICMYKKWRYDSWLTICKILNIFLLAHAHSRFKYGQRIFVIIFKRLGGPSIGGSWFFLCSSFVRKACRCVGNGMKYYILLGDFRRAMELLFIIDQIMCPNIMVLFKFLPSDFSNSIFDSSKELRRLFPLVRVICCRKVINIISYIWASEETERSW